MSFSFQILELLVLTAVVILILNKLFKVIGTTSEEDRYKQSYYGEPGIKDVTGTAQDEGINNVISSLIKNRKTGTALVELISEGKTKDEQNEILDLLHEIITRLPNFNPHRFLATTEQVARMIIDAAQKNDRQSLKNLVDQRYIDELLEKITDYQTITNYQNLDAKFSNVHIFGNNALIKIIFSDSKIKGKIVKIEDGQELKNTNNFNQEWTFSRRFDINGPEWYLSNIDIL